MHAGTKRILLTAFLLLLAIAALRDLARLGDALPWRAMDDFPDFFCAGAALDERASPYTYEPLHACEHRVNAGTTFRGRVFAANPALAVPAPQPAYDFLPFMALARLPFPLARAIDAAAILVAVAVCAAALAGLGVPMSLAVAALLLSTAYAGLNTGQIVPFSLAALVSCGLALSRGRDELAGVLAVATAIEPTVGLPVALATLAFVPRARVALTVTAAAFALAAFLLLGVNGFVSYFSGVLPAHAASELHFPFQYSLTYLAARAGFASATARAAGALSYVLLLALGLWLAPRAQRSFARRELFVFIPALCAVIAGPFLHQEELSFALPALLVLAVATRGAVRAVLAAALCALSIPWIAVWGMKQLFLASLFVCAVILATLRIQRWAAIGIFCATALTIYAFELHPPHLPTPVAITRQYSTAGFAEIAWRDYTAARASDDPLWVLIKLPAWAALLATLAVAVRRANA
jgi:Glycosyltransferase family 87